MAGYLVQVMVLVQRTKRPASELTIACMPDGEVPPRDALRMIAMECCTCRQRRLLSQTTHMDSGQMIAKSSAAALTVTDVIDKLLKGKAA